MKPQVYPAHRVGSLYIRPNWRYEALRNPAKYKLQDFIFQPESGSGCLKRYLKFGIPYQVNYVIPDFLREYLSQLDTEEGELLFRLWDKAFRKSGRKKISCDYSRKALVGQFVWRHTEVDRIVDDYLRRMIKHQSQMEYDPHIAFALMMFNSEEHKEIFRFIGYCIYAKVSDVDIAKRWNLNVKQVEAIRNIFFDFSRFPVDRLANLSYLRQMTYAGVFDEDDFAYYKRAFDLGELGIRAQTDFHGLNADEREVIQNYLGKSIIENTLNLNFSIKTQRDAYGYANLIGNLANYNIKHAELENIRAKTEQIKVQTAKLQSEVGKETTDLTKLDKHFMDVLYNMSLQDVRPVHRTFVDLKEE